MTNDNSIILLAPQLYGVGGIQAYMRRLREISAAYCEIKSSQFRCLSLADTQEEKQMHSRPVGDGAFIGCGGNKVRFVLETIDVARRLPSSLVIVGHLGQVPVAWVLRSLGLIESYILVLYGIEAWKKAAWLDRQAARSARCIVAITEYTAQEFCKHNGIPFDRTRIIPPTLAEEKIELRVYRQRIGTDLAILTVGRLSMDDRYKGIETLIEAVGQARNHGAKVHLTVAGDGDDLPRLKELALRLELDDTVAFVGAVPDSRLQELYQECDIFIMPSKKEGFGIVFLEAMRFQKPCIGGNHGGTPEVITHGVDGYLVDYGDVDQLTRYLTEFSRRPELRRQMGLRGYEKIKAGYLFPHMRDNWFALLDEFTAK